MKILVATAFPAKIDKKTVMGASLFEKDRIFGRFWGARRDPEISKNQREGFGKGVLGAIWEPSGSHVGRLVAFFPILTSFWECLGSLWARFSINFSSFFHHREVGKNNKAAKARRNARSD